MKKFSILLFIIMLFSMLSVAVYADDKVPTIYSDVFVTDDNTVEVLLSISEGSNIAGCSFNVVYDSDKLTYTNHEVKETISTMMNIVNPEYNSNAIRVLWADMKELTVGGDIIKIVFSINEGASGSTDIIIDKLTMMDISSMPVDCSCENKTIRLSDSEDNDEPIVDVPVEDDEPEDNSSNSNNNSSENGNSGNSASSNRPSSNNRPSSSTTNSGESESTKEPTEDDDKEPVIEDEEDITPDTDNEAEEDYEVILLGFEDVKETDWFYESVKFVKERQYMSGVSDTEFAPDSSLTRGMLVTILYRLSGEPECNEPTFEDVEKNMWYSDGIAWTAKNKIVNGVGENKFAPNSNITREQIALIMYNYSKLYGLDITESEDVKMFKDSGNVSTWAKDAIEWSVGAEILSGKGDGILDPKGNATRAEIATVLMRYTEKYDPN